MIFKFPEENKLQNYNVIQVFLKNAAERPVRLVGKVLSATDDGTELLLETENEYATFLCSEIIGVRFGVQ